MPGLSKTAKVLKKPAESKVEKNQNGSDKQETKEIFEHTKNNKNLSKIFFKTGISLVAIIVVAIGALFFLGEKESDLIEDINDQKSIPNKIVHVQGPKKL